ncbi:Putative Ig domain-containing protein [Sinosporangium album]|uniref:Putative Ig domain-containing protein n=1 Tax=Sinosporangium album TaxID=504805 RepID=A0A1G8CMC0_9ACTN|nr:putative Ig domain-containing protein [Sinosporangium album]SDH46628.1 Putative Ig domain-containing protein [Sinosporangium album]
MTVVRSGVPLGHRTLISAVLATAVGSMALIGMPAHASSSTPLQAAVETMDSRAAAQPVKKDPYPAPHPEDSPDPDPAPVFVTTSLNLTGTVGTAIAGQLSVQKLYGVTVTYSVVDAAKLPAGITISASGAISGTPREAGTYRVPVKVCTNLGTCTNGTVTFTIAAQQTVEFTVSASSAAATVGVAYSGAFTFTSSIGSAVTVTVTDTAALPPGLTFSADGKITGTPTKAGTYEVPVRMCAGGVCQTASLTIVVNPAPTTVNWKISITYTGVVGQAGSGSITVTGTPPGAGVTYTVTDPSKLPPGITITADGKITGTATTPGTYTFPVKVCAGALCTTLNVTITVGAPATSNWKISITYTGVAGRPASGSITVTGTPPGAGVTYTVTDPSKLPPGITITADGKITGTATASGSYAVPIKVCAGTVCGNIVVTLTITTAVSSTLSISVDGFNGVAGRPATGTLTVTGLPAGGTPTFTVTDPGKLPPGITITADGKITGTATTGGSYVVPMRLCMGTACVDFTITLNISTVSSSVRNITLVNFSGSVGPVTGRFIMEGVESGVSFTVTDPSKLPPGVTVRTDGTLVGTATVAGTYTFPVRMCVGTACGTASLTMTILPQRPVTQTVKVTATIKITAGRPSTAKLPGRPGQIFTVLTPANLPPGISITSDGRVIGTAKAIGKFAVQIEVATPGGASETWQTTFEVCNCAGALSVSPFAAKR